MPCSRSELRSPCSCPSGVIRRITSRTNPPRPDVESESNSLIALPPRADGRDHRGPAEQLCKGRADRGPTRPGPPARPPQAIRNDAPVRRARPAGGVPGGGGSALLAATGRTVPRRPRGPRASGPTLPSPRLCEAFRSTEGREGQPGCQRLSGSQARAQVRGIEADAALRVPPGANRERGRAASRKLPMGCRLPMRSCQRAARRLTLRRHSNAAIPPARAMRAIAGRAEGGSRLHDVALLPDYGASRSTRSSSEGT